MEYILNKSKVRTTEHAKINDLHLDLDIPKITNFSNFNVSGIDYKEYDSNEFESRIGLILPKSHNLDIDVTKDGDISISYDIDNILVDNININVAKNINTNITIKYTSTKDIYHISKLNLNIDTSSKVIVNYVNLISRNSKSFIAIESNVLGNLEVNLIDMGGNTKVNNYYSNIVGEQAKSTLNNIYIAKDNDVVDMNYYVGLTNRNDEGYINVSGVLDDNAHKNFKGIIDFIKGSSKSIGKELEKVTLLSDTSITKSLPVLLCHEEDVEGAHGVSTGKIDNDKLFYMMSRGITYKEALILIIKSDFDIALNKLTDKEKEEIENIIEERI
nr:SufD family Fe-S cluster assembly protein [Bacilli bacterium]